MLVCGYRQQSILRKVCNALFESILNHILTIKHLKITVGEYTYGLPRFLLGDVAGHGIQPIRYRMLKRWILLIYQELIFGAVLIKIISQGLALSCCIVYQQMI